MLNKIRIKDVFAHKDTTINFEKGLTRLHGANEAGKSQVFEMIRWGLFGNKALRTSPDDYKGGSVELTFLKDYKVNRTSGNAVLYKNDEVIARSTTAVNKKIIELVGYGLKTYDNVNSINQNEVEKLTSMGLPERKKFLDELIGAAEIDKLIADYKADLTAADAEIKALEGLVSKVTAPAMPKGLRPLELIQKDQAGADEKVTQIRIQENSVSVLERQLQQAMALPDPMPQNTLEEVQVLLEQAEENEKAQKEARIGYPMIARLIDSGAGPQDVASLKADVDTILRARQARKPKFTREEIVSNLEKHKANDAFEKVTKLRVELESYTSCPRCGLSFEDEAAATTAKINELLPIARPYKGLPSREALGEAEIENTVLENATSQLAGVTNKYAQMFSEPVGFSQETFDRIEGILTSSSISLSMANRSLTAKREKARIENLEHELNNEKTKLQALDSKKVAAYIMELRQERAARDQYDLEVRHYDEQAKRNAEIVSKVEERKKDREETANVVKALQGFKYYINTYFLPSVGKAASAMLVTMTNGKRKKISITDKFEIDVDGKKVEALSGSTKAIVNIALRFALQFVLTKNTFSVFMADEVDGSFDDNRAKYLNECMVGMTDHLDQVIVISHKPITAQHNIKL